MKEKSNVRFCRYVVIDIKTGMNLISGDKYKDLTGLTHEGSFRRFFRKINRYTRIAKVNGRMCYIIYWTLHKPGRKISVLTYAGVWYRMNGMRADLTDAGDDKCYDELIRLTGLRKAMQEGKLS